MTDKPNNNVPSIGSRHYQMAGLSFFINRTPKDVIQEWLLGAIQQLQQSGNFKVAKELTQNPQPFYGQPHAMAVFMAASAELEKSNARIAKLEAALLGIATAIRESEGADPDSWFTETLCPAVEEAAKAVEAKPDGT